MVKFLKHKIYNNVLIMENQFMKAFKDKESFFDLVKEYMEAYDCSYNHAMTIMEKNNG